MVPGGHGVKAQVESPLAACTAHVRPHSAYAGERCVARNTLHCQGLRQRNLGSSDLGSLCWHSPGWQRLEGWAAVSTQAGAGQGRLIPQPPPHMHPTVCVTSHGAPLKSWRQSASSLVGSTPGQSCKAARATSSKAFTSPWEVSTRVSSRSALRRTTGGLLLASEWPQSNTRSGCQGTNAPRKTACTLAIP